MTSNQNFITIEGVDGAGKSTHVVKLVEQLRAFGFEVAHTREPGGTALGETLRDMLLHAPMSAKTETMLMFAARNEHLEQIIRPALAAGKIVVCDRFTDSTWAYQGGAKNVADADMEALVALVHPDLQPGLTILFDLPIEISKQRLEQTGKTPDKFERENPKFHESVRQTYLKLSQDPRYQIVDSSVPVDQVADQVEAILMRHLCKLRPTTQAGRANGMKC